MPPPLRPRIDIGPIQVGPPPVAPAAQLGERQGPVPAFAGPFGAFLAPDAAPIPGPAPAPRPFGAPPSSSAVAQFVDAPTEVVADAMQGAPAFAPMGPFAPRPLAPQASYLHQLPQAPAQPAPAPAAAPRPPVFGRPTRSASASAPTQTPAQAPNAIDEMMAQRRPFETPRETPLQREQRFAASIAQLEQRRAELAARAGADAADIEEGYRQRADDLESERQAATSSARDAYSRAMERAGAMTVDPSRTWSRAGAGGQVLGAISVGLGALGEALGGGPNRALEQIQATIDRDISAQERDIANANANVENRRGVLSEIRSDFASREAALEATRATMLRQAAAQTESQAALLGSEEAAQRGRMMSEQLAQQAAAAEQRAQLEEARAQLQLRRELARTVRMESEATRAARRAAGGTGAPAGPGRVSSAQWQAYSAAMAAGLTQDQARASAGIPAEYTPTQAPLTTEQRGTLDAMDATMRDLEGVVASADANPSAILGPDIPGVGVVDSARPAILQSAEGNRVQQLLENLTDLFGRLRSGGAISADEEARFRSIIEGAGTEQGLRDGLSILRREMSARLGYGARPQATQDAAAQALGALGARPVR